MPYFSIGIKEIKQKNDILELFVKQYVENFFLGMAKRLYDIIAKIYLILKRPINMWDCDINNNMYDKTLHYGENCEIFKAYLWD